MAADIYERIRDASRDLIITVAEDDLDLDGNSVYSDDSFDVNRTNLPAVAVTYEGGPIRFTGGTNLSDYVVYPLMLGYYGAGPMNEPGQRNGPTLTQFQDVMRGLFHMKKLAAMLDEVIECRIVPGPLGNALLPQFEKLLVAVGLEVEAIVPRAKTSS